MFKDYGDGQLVLPGMEPKTVIQAGVGVGAALAALGLLAVVAGRKLKQ